MKRDARRFLFCDFRLLEVPNRVPLDLGKLWRARYGIFPTWEEHLSIQGFHFFVGDRERGVVVRRPNRLAIENPLQKRLCAVIAAKHLCEVRVARADEVPTLRVPTRLTRPGDLAMVEEFPTGTPPGEVVLAYRDRLGFVPSTPRFGHVSKLDRALIFDDPQSAYEFVERYHAHDVLAVRYRAAELAARDQHEAAMAADAGGS